MEIREAVCHGRRPGPSTAISAACACVESVLGHVTAGWDCKGVWREGREGVEGSVGGGGVDSDECSMQMSHNKHRA